MRPCKHVVFIADIPTTGGATACLLELVGCLNEKYGIKTTVCTAQKSSLNEKLARVGAQRVVTGHDAFLTTLSKTTWKKPASFTKRFVRWKTRNARAIKVAEQSIDFNNVDIIHSNLPRNDVGIVLARKHGLPHICHLRENSFEYFKLDSLKMNPGRYLSDSSDALVAVSESVKNNWVRRGVDPTKVKVIYDAINSSTIERYVQTQGARKLFDGTGVLHCAFLGGYYEGKGLPSLLQALSKLNPSTRAKLHVIVCGEGRDSASGKAAAEFVRKHGLSTIVELNGYAKDVPQLLLQCDVGIACSKAEAFGRIILEYRAAGLAIVAARSGSFPELINDGVDGFLYDEKGISTLDCVLERLVENPTLIKHTAEANRIIRTEKDVASEVVELYTNVLEKRWLAARLQEH